MGILNIDLNIYDEDDPDTVILIKHLAWYTNFEKHKEHINPCVSIGTVKVVYFLELSAKRLNCFFKVFC